MWLHLLLPPTLSHKRASEEFIYETAKRQPARQVDDDEFLEDEAKKFGRENLCSVASIYQMP